MKKYFAVLSLAVLTFNAQADVSLAITAGELRYDAITPMPSSGQIIVAASTESIFSGPTPESFVSGNDVLLFRGTIGNGDGIFDDLITFNLNALGVQTGNPVQLYWFPTLTSADTAPGFNTPFGAYHHPTGLDGSAPWFLPSDGTLSHTLTFQTASLEGSNPDLAGYANFTTVPEPSTYALLLLGGLGWFFLRKGRKN
jgi:hypothetical protein